MMMHRDSPADAPRIQDQGTAARWNGALSLCFDYARGRTVLARRAHQGPLMVQRVFYPEPYVARTHSLPHLDVPAACHAYILHPPGGLVGGDALTLTIDCTARARVLVTTPAAGKFYRSTGAEARQSQVFSIAPDARLEWLPQETILFSGSRSRLATRVHLMGSAGYFGWDLLCLGRAASGLPFVDGLCRQTTELWRDGRPLLIDRGLHAAGHPALTAPWGLHGHDVIGTLLATPADTQHCESARSAIARHSARMGQAAGAGRVAATLVRDVLVCRGLARAGPWLRQVFEAIWTELRPALAGVPAVAPRVWAT